MVRGVSGGSKLSLHDAERRQSLAQELKLASFHELASVKKLADVLNASLIARRFFLFFRKTERLALRTSLSFFKLTSSWKSRGWPFIILGGLGGGRSVLFFQCGSWTHFSTIVQFFFFLVQFLCKFWTHEKTLFYPRKFLSPNLDVDRCDARREIFSKFC